MSSLSHLKKNVLHNNIVCILDGADNVPESNVTAVNETNGRVKLRWPDPPAPNGLIVTYEIKYSKVGVTNVSSSSYFKHKSIFGSLDSDIDIWKEVRGQFYCPSWLRVHGHIRFWNMQSQIP